MGADWSGRGHPELRTPSFGIQETCSGFHLSAIGTIRTPDTPLLLSATYVNTPFFQHGLHVLRQIGFKQQPFFGNRLGKA